MFGPSKESNLQHHRCLHNELPHKEWLDPSIRTFFPYLAQKSLLKCAYMFCIVLAKLIDLLFSCRTQLAILHHNENVKWEQVADIEWKLRFAWKHLTAKKHWVYSSKHIYLVGLCLKTNFRIICLCHILRHIHGLCSAVLLPAEFLALFAFCAKIILPLKIQFAFLCGTASLGHCVGSHGSSPMYQMPANNVTSQWNELSCFVI